MKQFKSLIASILIACITFLPITSQAGIIGTDTTIALQQNISNVEKVKSFLSREDVIAKYESMGLSSKISKERVDALTQEEVNLVAAQIDSLPAGGYITETGGVIIAFALIIIVWIIARDQK
jgi:hypothetical protein